MIASNGPDKGITHRLIVDDDFLRWVKFADKQPDVCWKTAVVRQAAFKRNVEEARRLVQQLQFAACCSASGRKEVVFTKIKEQIREWSGQVKKRNLQKWRWWLVGLYK